MVHSKRKNDHRFKKCTNTVLILALHAFWEFNILVIKKAVYHMTHTSILCGNDDVSEILHTVFTVRGHMVGGI